MERPRTSRCLEKIGKGRALVKMSAGISPVGIHVVEKEPSWTWEQIKWWRISMCFERADTAGDRDSAQAAWLSLRIGKGRGIWEFQEI